MATEMNLITRQQLLDKRRQLEEVADYAIQKKEIERLLKEVDSALERIDKGSYYATLSGSKRVTCFPRQKSSKPPLTTFSRSAAVHLIRMI